MDADFCYATMKNSVKAFQRRRRTRNPNPASEKNEEEYVDEFGRKRKRTNQLESDDEEDPKRIVNYMRPKAPGFYNFSADEQLKQQQIHSITTSHEPNGDASSYSLGREKRIKAARERNARIRSLQQQQQL